jgi:ATP-dependent Clp protease ATP-binding subunit ClpA
LKGKLLDKRSSNEIARSIQRNRAGLKIPRQLVLLFLGQTGVGKTQLAKFG